MTKRKTPPSTEPLTAYAEDQLRRLREYMDSYPHSGGMAVTCSGPPLPAIWQGLEESGTWSEKRTDAWVKPT